MKKLIYLAGFFIFFVSMVHPVAAGPLSAGDGQVNPPPNTPDSLSNPIYLPMIMSPSILYTVSGQIKDAGDKPLSGVSIASDSGQMAVTDANGVYQMKVEHGERQVTASKPGYKLDPRPAWLNLNRNMNNVNFSSGAACTQPVPNPSFETVPYYWNPISGMANGYTPNYTNLRANTGTYSGLTGILDGFGYPNVSSWSRWRTHEITIPAAATSADVSLFYWQKSTETILKVDSKAANIVGLNADAEKLPTAADYLYIAVIDASTNVISTTLLQTLGNGQVWTSSGTLSFLAFAGKTVKLEFGTVNDGIGGVTSTFFDDVVINVCDETTTTPGCSNILLNSDFSAATDWTIRTAVNPSVFSTLDFYSAPQSMLSGVAIGATPPVPNGFQTSEFFQEVTIPLNATSATLAMRLKPRSSDLLGYKVEEQAAIDSLLANGKLPEATASQYGYLCTNCNGTSPTTINTLFFWPSLDSATWLFRQITLTGYKGQTIGVLFGAVDDGRRGNTSLFVDDVTLTVCTP